eukprot:CAMPEP_0184312362 /NCGR_PEP_ID=MMETSP1049-20130417/49509_1 /TAXON_ID=77928 /ORGANISM="Proteomonas sulcata, Strain CCMP704" /LENGTH=110 /DNA_ID=CAMNT_0026628457 /DNA_START=303 /DNA_END=635 /DNA_ORIENTATION=+
MARGSGQMKEKKRMSCVRSCVLLGRTRDSAAGRRFLCSQLPTSSLQLLSSPAPQLLSSSDHRLFFSCEAPSLYRQGSSSGQVHSSQLLSERLLCLPLNLQPELPALFLQL